MTVGEVRDFQRVMKASKANKSNAPVGRYQFVPETLNEVLGELNIQDTAIFDAPLQDRLADALLNKAGLEKYYEGKLRAEDLQLALAKRWAVIAAPGSIYSYYRKKHPDPAKIQGPAIQKIISGESRYRW